MIKIKVICVGKSKEEWLRAAISEYVKRLSSTVSLEWTFAADDEKLKKMLEQEKNFIALSPDGLSLDSIAFSQKLMQQSSKIVFAIGGPEGLSPDLLRRAAAVWSLSPLTFTHQITRLILIEQIYRALAIQKKSPYHK